MSPDAQMGQIIKTETGYSFNYRRSRTHKQMNPDTKRIENETTTEAGLTGHEETYDAALTYLMKAKQDVNLMVSQESET